MATYTFKANALTTTVEWDDPTTWVGGVVPDGPDAVQAMMDGHRSVVWPLDRYTGQQRDAAKRQAGLADSKLSLCGHRRV